MCKKCRFIKVNVRASLPTGFSSGSAACSVEKNPGESVGGQVLTFRLTELRRVPYFVDYYKHPAPSGATDKMSNSGGTMSNSSGTADDNTNIIPVACVLTYGVLENSFGRRIVGRILKLRLRLRPEVVQYHSVPPATRRLRPTRVGRLATPGGL
jgi:hypothetical protein